VTVSEQSSVHLTDKYKKNRELGPMRNMDRSIKKHSNRIDFSGVLLLGTISMLILSGAVMTATATIPGVLKIENISQDSAGKIRLQISHASPSANHYVDVIQIDVNGQIKTYNITQPQTTDPFSGEFDLGQIQGTPTVKARAHCNIHGWSTWSDGVAVPEFSQVELTVLATLAAALLIARRTKRSNTFSRPASSKR